MRPWVERADADAVKGPPDALTTADRADEDLGVIMTSDIPIPEPASITECATASQAKLIPWGWGRRLAVPWRHDDRRGCVFGSPCV